MCVLPAYLVLTRQNLFCRKELVSILGKKRVERQCIVFFCFIPVLQLEIFEITQLSSDTSLYSDS